MKGILKSNHQRLWEWLQEIKEMEPIADSNLHELEKEWQALFLSYQEKMHELKRLVLVYDEKQKTIRNEIKRILKYNNGLQESKKINNIANRKAII